MKKFDHKEQPKANSKEIVIYKEQQHQISKDDKADHICTAQSSLHDDNGTTNVKMNHHCLMIVLGTQLLSTILFLS